MSGWVPVLQLVVQLPSFLFSFLYCYNCARRDDLLPHLGRTEPAAILGASAIWQGGEGPGHEALLGRAAGQARGTAFERRHSGNSRESCAKSKNCAKKKN